MHRYSKMFILVCVAVTLGPVAIISMLISVSTEYWLFVVEDIPFEYFAQYDTIEYDYLESMPNVTFPDKIVVSANMGLWKYCVTAEGFTFCTPLDYNTPKEPRQEISIAIAESQRSSTPCFLTGLVIIVGAFLFSIPGATKWKTCTFVSGICYVTSAICDAIGIIVYITNVESEVELLNKPPDMTLEYAFGWSIYFMGLSMIVSLMTTVVCTTIYYLPSNHTRPMPEMKMKILNSEDNDTENEITIV